MKKNFCKLFSLTIGLSLCLASCNSLEDNDYYKDLIINNANEEIHATSLTVAQYIQERNDLKQMAALFQQQGIFDELPNSGELHTILVVTDQNFVTPAADSALFIARSHVSNISVSPSKLNDNDRLLMWHNKYVTVSVDPEAATGDIIGHVMFNKSALQEVIMAEDGFIYVIGNMINTPTSLEDYINGLDEEHSLFKNMVLASGGKEFDKANSKVIGIDDKGNTLYDSVFKYTNTFFDSKGFYLSDESLKATMFVFSNEVIRQALEEAKEKLKFWGYDYKSLLLRNGSKDSVYVGYTSDKDLEDWILKAAFYRNVYSIEDLTPALDAKSPTDNDKRSIYDCIWRTSVQELDLEHPIKLSNGMAYEVKKFRIPNHRLIYRLHEEFRYYAQCDADQKELYFKLENLAFSKISNDEVAPWTPLSGVWDPHGNSPLIMKITDNTVADYKFDFTPIYSRPNNQGGYNIGALMVPPGSYRMAMGFKQGMSNLTVQLFAVNVDGETACSEPTLLPLIDGSTTYHYDRGATLSNRLPEYYDVNDPRLTAGNKNGYYWTDGGLVFNEVEIPDLNGDGSALQLLIRMTGDNGKSAGNLTFNHWCLRPTVNNY